MALSASTIFEVRTTGSDTNGGGYSSGGVDYSQQDAAQVALTDMVIDATTNTKFTSTTLGSSDNYIGNIINVTAGTGFTVQRVQIVSRSGAVYTCDKSLGTLSSTGGTGNLGGALATPQQACTIATVAGHVIYVKNTANYALTGASVTPSPFSGQVALIGYGTTRGDNVQAVFDGTGMTAGTNTVTVGDHVTVANIKVINPKRNCFLGSGQSQCWNCDASGWTNQGFEAFQLCVNCKATTGSSGQGFWNNTTCIGCVSTGSSFRGSSCYFCIVNGSSATGFDGQQGNMFMHCTAYNVTGSGFGESNQCAFINCLAYGCSAYGFNRSNPTAPTDYGYFRNCAAGNNSSGNTNGGSTKIDAYSLIALTADPFTNKSGGDFSLNNTAGGGAACRAAGFPGAFPGGTTTGYLDIGAVQHADSGGTAGMLYHTGGG